MEIAQTAAPTAQPAASSLSAGADISSDFETFLKLLTAQISNQDPMDPMKSEEFAVQLATFSGVEQQAKTNDLIEQMMKGNAGGDFAAFSSWIGREAKAPMPVHFSGSPMTLDIPAPRAGDRHQLVVRDESGGELHRVDVSGQGGQTVWDGRLGGDGTVPNGTYRFEVESFDQGAMVATTPLTPYAKVTEIRSSEAGPVLVFQGGVQVPAGEVTALREASDRL